jgi:PAS domain S-box-containing protein
MRLSETTGRTDGQVEPLERETLIAALQAREERLRLSEERLRLAQLSGDVGVFDWDLTTGALSWTPELEALWGLEPGTVSSYEDFRRRVHPEDLDEMEARRDAALRAHQQFDVEFRIVRPSGEIRWVTSRGQGFYDEAGELVRVLGNNMDVTDRRRAEEALREGQERLQLATEAAGIGTFDWDIETGVNLWTPQLEAMYGLAPGEFGKTQPAWEQLVHEDDRPAAVALVERTLETGRPVQGEWRVVWRDGSVRWISGRFQGIKDQQGKARRLIGVNIDITDLVLAQRAVQESEARYRAIVELADEDLMVSSDGTYSFKEKVEDAGDGRARFKRWVLRLADSARRHRWRVLVAAIAFESAFLFLMGLTSTSREILGLPGSLLALTVVVAAVLAGWQVGLAAALVGGVIFWGTVASFGADSAPATLVLSTLIWVAAALLAGLLTDSLTEQLRLRKSAAVALARAETLREQEAERAAQEERVRIARDLHDSVTQSLFAATLRAEALTIMGDQPPATAAGLQDVHRLNRGALAQMRTMLLELRGDPVEEVPLQQLLRHLVEAAESRAGVKVVLSTDQPPALAPRIHEAAYRIAQEALNNVVRHAKAENAWVQVRGDDGHVRLVVGDDGKGFDPARVGQGHFGLAFMRERAEETGGEVSVKSADGEGTVVIADWRSVGERSACPPTDAPPAV